MAARKETAGTVLWDRRELTMDRETKGTFRFTGENYITGRDDSVYIQKADLKGWSASDTEDAVIRVTIELLG